MSKQKETYYQVKLKITGKHNDPNVRISSGTEQGVISVKKKRSMKEIEDYVLKGLDLKPNDPDITLTAKVEIKKLKMDFFIVYE